jgi:hypothetical protein
MPLDPGCPEVIDFKDRMYNDPMATPVIDDIMEDFDRRHMRECQRCQEYGAANIEVI